MLGEVLVKIARDFRLHLHQACIKLRLFLFNQRGPCQRGTIEISICAEQLLSLGFQVRILLLKQVLLAAEVMVENNLFLQVVHHLVSNFICLVDLVCDRFVTCRELIKCAHLLRQVLITEHELVLPRVLQ